MGLPRPAQPGERFHGELRYHNRRWRSVRMLFLAFPDRVYTVDFGRRALRSLFTARAGDNVVDTGIYKDSLTKQEVLVVSAEKSFHFLAPDGSPLVSIPRVHDCFGYHIALGKLADPQRYFAWYQPYPWALFVEPAVSGTLPILFHEYDAGGRELAHHDHPQFPYPMASYKKASFGLVTPMTEAATLVGVSQHLRSVGRAQRSIRPPVLLDYLENIQYYIPGTSHFEATPAGLIPGYIALILLSAMACALGCVVLARRSAFSGVRAIGWAVIGFMFGWVGLILMLVLQEWPAACLLPRMS